MQTFSHEFDLPIAPDRALPLFTPKGEESWVPGWAPHYITPENGDTVRGMIFTTGAGADQILWTCLDYAPEEGHARYFRAVPGNRISIVEVHCVSDGDAGSRVTVSYAHASLGEAGDEFIRAQSTQGFAAEIDQWRGLIMEHCPQGRDVPA